MSKTVAELVSWLKSQDAIRMVLVEVEEVTGSGAATLYLSSKPYNTSLGVGYDPCIVGGLSFNESISLDGSPSIGYGDIEILNYDGSRDSWLTWIWANRQVKIFVGDPRWSRDDFYNIFTGVISDITTSSLTSLNLVLLNKLDRLNNPISEKTLGSLYPKVGEVGGIAGNENRPVGAVQNRDSILPLCFGECFNITPLHISSALTTGTTNELTYMVHNGPIQEILEVRDNGIPISNYIPSLSTGTFTLTSAPAGTITCSVQGSKLGGTYLNKIADIVTYIVQNYGPTVSRFTPAEIYMLPTALAKTAAVGIYVTDRDNIIDICTKIVSSVGGYITCTYSGTLIIGFLDLIGIVPEVGIPTEITPDNIALNSLNVSEKPVVKGAVKLGYCYNWTEQLSGLAGGVPQSSQDLFAKPWLFITKTDAAVVSLYKLDTHPVEEYTYLIAEADALAEAERRLNLWNQPRFVYTVDGFSELLAVLPGTAISLRGYRFGLDTEKTGVVVFTDKDWITCKVKIGVLV